MIQLLPEMKWLRAALLSMALWAVVAPWAANSQPEPKVLCFFSLNNAQEYDLTRDLLDGGNHGIYAVEFHDPRQHADPASSFRAMIERQPVCDGLVISGHHTGSFGGKRARGVLSIDLLEELSCDPDHAGFFERVNAVWLQGCRTLGVGPADPADLQNSELQADYHMQRVGADMLQNGLEQSFTDLSYEFSTTLDQDNPLASRYMRVFPRANLFGWTRSSPGLKAQSEKSLLYHMSHMTHLSQGEPLFNPLQDNSPARKRAMRQSLRQTMHSNSSQGQLARDAWLSHGQVKTAGLGYDNPNLNAYAPLLQTSEQRLLQAKTLGCSVRNARSLDELQQTLPEVLSSHDAVAYNLNAVLAAYREYAGASAANRDLLQSQMINSSALLGLLNSKLQSPQTGLLMKIEYYMFYRELTGHTLETFETHTRDNVRHFLLAQNLAGSEYDVRDFREALLASVARHQLADESFYQGIVHAPEARGDTLYAVAWSFQQYSPEFAESILNEIVNHPQANSNALRAAAIWQMEHGVDGEHAILAAILAHPQADEETLSAVASVLVQYEFDGSAALLEDIVAHPATGSSALRQASLAIRKHDIAVDRSLLQDIQSHPRVDAWGLENVARIMAKNPPG